MTADDIPVDGRTLQQILDEAVALRDDVKAAEAVRRVKERLMIALLVVAVAALGGLTFVGVKLVQIGSDAKRSAERVEDCTTAGGRCYEDGTKRTGGAVRNLIQAQIAVAECAQTTETDAELEACVEAKLAAKTP